MSIAVRPVEPRPNRFGPGLGATFVARVRRAVADLAAVLRETASDGEGREVALAAELAEARLMASRWQRRAVTAEARSAALEARLSEAEMTSLELRSRVVCLHGKLATSAATVRYQSMTLALDDRLARRPAEAKAS